jgi:hypothetical protein
MILAHEQEGRLRAEQGSDGPPSLVLAQNEAPVIVPICIDARRCDLPDVYEKQWRYCKSCWTGSDQPPLLTRLLWIT